MVGNGTPSIGPNGFGRGTRRTVPGAEPAQPAAAAVPGAEPAEGNENLSKAAQKNKKKRNRKPKDPEGNKESGAAGGGASLAPPQNGREHGPGGDRRSPERRGQGGNQNGNHRDHRSQSRNPSARRNRSNAARGQAGNGNAQSSPAPPATAGAGGQATGNSVDTSQNPNAKKIRSLQKKVRAIEDLEMRLAGGEKLEDTQMKKIATKASVLKELEALE